MLSRLATTLLSRALACPGPASGVLEQGICGASPLARLLSTQSQVAGQTSSGSSEASTSGRPPGDVKPDLVQQFLGLHNMNTRQRMTQERKEIIRSVQRHEADCGSPAVVCAVWTHKLREQTKSFYRNPKNFENLRKFEMMMHRRRRMMGFLRKADFKGYAAVIGKIGLADVFGRITAGDRYPVGQAHDNPAGAADYIRRVRFAYQKRFRIKRCQQWKRVLPQLQLQDPKLPPKPVAELKGSVHRRKPVEKGAFAENSSATSSAAETN